MERIPGLSALVRLRDEEIWCRLALESFEPWCDELVIVTNCCTDRTPEIVAEFAARHPAKVQVYDYPHQIWPMGLGWHDLCPPSDPRASAAFYNFTQSKATRSHAVKLDGDMIMLDWSGAAIRELMAEGHDRIRFHGTDLVGDDLRHIGSHPMCRTNGVYRLGPGVRYEQGPVTQNLRGVPPASEAFDRPAFVHMKWCRKSFASATVQWPPDWQSIPHFQRIAERRHPIRPYMGEYPSSIRRLLELETA